MVSLPAKEGNIDLNIVDGPVDVGINEMFRQLTPAKLSHVAIGKWMF